MNWKKWSKQLGKAVKNRFWGAFFGMNPITAALSVGWSQRRARQSILRSWVLKSPYANELTSRLYPESSKDKDKDKDKAVGIENVAQSTSSDIRPFLPHPIGTREDCELIREPRWVIPETWPSPRYSRANRRMEEVTWKDRILSPFQSLCRNWSFGWQGVFPTATLLVPIGCILWFAWAFGWNNSFNKGYEQAPVGPLTSFIGIGFFIWFWSHIPMAQACQAASGNWKSFYRWRLIRKLIWTTPMRYLGLLGMYLALAIPVMFVESAPGLITSGKSQLEFLSAQEAVDFLINYHFLALFIVIFPAFALLKRMAAKVYADAVIMGLGSGKIKLDELSSWESEVIVALGLDRLEPPVESPIWKRMLVFMGKTGTHLVFRISMGLIGFGLIGATFYIPQFIGYQSFPRWVNPVIIQLPWYHRLPGHLKESLEEEKALKAQEVQESQESQEVLNTPDPELPDTDTDLKSE